MALSISNAADCHIPASARLRGAYLYIIFGALHLQAAQVSPGHESASASIHTYIYMPYIVQPGTYIYIYLEYTLAMHFCH